MKNRIVRNCLVVGIIMLFVGTSIISGLRESIKDKVDDITSDMVSSRLGFFESNTTIDASEIIDFNDNMQAIDDINNDFGSDTQSLFDGAYRDYWSVTEVVSTESTSDSTWPSLAVDSSDVMHVAWDDQTDYGGSGSDDDIFYKSTIDVNWYAFQEFANGSGTSDNPYQITHIEHLNNVRDYLDSYFILMNDLDFECDDSYLNASNKNDYIAGNGWLPIGDINNNFTGSFDGQNYTISNLFIDRSTNYIGLFGIMKDGGSISYLGLSYIDVNGGQYVGGLVGSNIGSSISNCYSTGFVNGSGWYSAGLVGRNEGIISYSYSLASITGMTHLGGLVGGNYGGSISNSYANGDVTGDTFVGGLVGARLIGSITNCYSTGYVYGYYYYIGGLVGGGPSHSVYSSFYDNQTSGQTTSAGGTGKNTVEMKDFNTFDTAGWDIAKIEDWVDETWFIDYGNDYPRLWWEELPPHPPINFTATADGRFQIDLSWEIGNRSDSTYICYAEGDIPPADRDSGLFLYNDTGESTSIIGLCHGMQYSFSAWSWNATYNTWSSRVTEDATTAANHPPVLSNENPVNNSLDRELSLIWTITIQDPDGDSFNWTIECSNGQNSGGIDESNGTKSLSLHGLEYSTMYTVWVNATDGYDWVRGWFTFTTKVSQPPAFGTPSPANGSTNQPLSLTWSIPISDPEGDLFDWTIQCSNGQSSNGNSEGNGTKPLMLSDLEPATTYTVWVNATDPSGSGLYTREWYTFRTQHPKLDITDIKGGLFTINAVIENIGEVPVNDIHWNISAVGGFLGRINETRSGRIPYLGAHGDWTTVSSGPLWGFGTITITVQANAPGVKQQSTVSGFVFLCYIIIY